MPRIDERFQGLPYTQGFMIMGRGPDGTSSVGRVDVTSGAVDYWDHGAKVTVQEPQFVPRSAAAGEGDGWLLAIINRLEAGHSELGIFDARHLAKGPIARLHIPVRVRSTFHGSWVPEEALRK
jgi:carotenoid cleavage dioxygenase-like enzyme